MASRSNREGSRTEATRESETGDMTLAEALSVVKAKQSPEAIGPLTLCCYYLKTGERIPRELALWLDQYLTSERRQIRGKRAIDMTNLAVVLQKTAKQKAATGRGKLTIEIEAFAKAVGIDVSTAKKWRRQEKFHAVWVIHQHLLKVLGLRL